jgi:hypothetical protein
MMRFCNESANIGIFSKLPTAQFKKNPFSISLLDKDSVYNRFHSNNPASDDRIP